MTCALLAVLVHSLKNRALAASACQFFWNFRSDRLGTLGLTMTTPPLLAPEAIASPLGPEYTAWEIGSLRAPTLVEGAIPTRAVSRVPALITFLLNPKTMNFQALPDSFTSRLLPAAPTIAPAAADPALSPGGMVRSNCKAETEAVPGSKLTERFTAAPACPETAPAVNTGAAHAGVTNKENRTLPATLGRVGFTRLLNQI